MKRENICVGCPIKSEQKSKKKKEMCDKVVLCLSRFPCFKELIKIWKKELKQNEVRSLELILASLPQTGRCPDRSGSFSDCLIKKKDVKTKNNKK